MTFFLLVVAHAIKSTKYLISILRMVDGEKEPLMDFIYNAKNEVK